jgi:ABC-2 type transport system ATP-binding protein
MQKTNNSYAIETISLTKIFPDWWGRARVVAVDNLDLKIKHNQIYGLLGPNGSGKTTTLKMLLSLLHPTKGKAVVLGGNCRESKICSRIGYLPEESYLYKYLNARESLNFYGRLFNLPGNVRKSRVEALLEMVGLAGMGGRAVGTYSKGMARRIGLAQAMINDPELLILDEPTSGMDPIGTRQMKELLVELARRGKTILLCSHLLADVEDVCDRIGILYGGKMRVEGKVGDLLEESDKQQIVTGSISKGALGRIEEIIRRENSECEITSPMNSLEDFFVRTVVAAEKEHLPTSGAVSSPIASHFSTEKPLGSGILDKLVLATVRKEEPVEKTETEPVQTPAETEKNNEMLEKLTKTTLEVQADAAVETTEVDTTASGSVESDEQVRQDILNKLRNDAEPAGGDDDA